MPNLKTTLGIKFLNLLSIKGLQASDKLAVYNPLHFV